MEERPVPQCAAFLVLWSAYFVALAERLSSLADAVRRAGALVLNDVGCLVHMQDRTWVLKKLREHSLPMPGFVDCIRAGGCEPVLEEHRDQILVAGQCIKKPFVEKPADRRDRQIYVYFTEEAGGGRALLSSRESGDVECCWSFDPVGRVRREGSFVYQEYLQSEGFTVHVTCAGSLAYGNAVLSDIVAPTGVASMDVRAAGPCPVWLRQEEKVMASKISVILGQTLFGITFVRSQTAGGPGTSYVVDVWPGLPSSGIEPHCDDIVKALLAVMGARMSISNGMQRSASTPTFDTRQVHSRADVDMSLQEPAMARICELEEHREDDEKESDRVCVLVVARHSERTPKQKVKAKLTLASESAAGWLCGWLAGSSADALMAVAPPATLELRAPEQLARLHDVAKALHSSGQQIGTLVDALECVSRAGMACHAKVSGESSKLTIALKWGGELTPAGASDAEDFGRQFRRDIFPDEDFDELHATLRHDIKVYASREPRCQQTAAAFCKGLLRLHSPLPPIMAALVRVDEFGSLDPDTVGAAGSEVAPQVVGKDQRQPLIQSLAHKPWPEFKAVLKYVDVAKCLLAHDSLASAMRELQARFGHLCDAMESINLGPLYLGETSELFRDRYRDAFERLGATMAEMADTIPHVLDHLVYERRHNLSALPATVQAALQETCEFCEALCDVVVHIDALEKGEDTARAAQLLHKLRWDLRVASGADLGGEKEHLRKHEALYAAVSQKSSLPCVRTRLYFSHNSRLQALLGVLLQGGGEGGACDCTSSSSHPGGGLSATRARP